ncbi:unnamed protein product [Camellia sinensis]
MGSDDAIVIGSLIGGFVAATQLVVKGAKVLVLEKYVIPGGSSGGNLNLITQALAAVGCKMQVIPDPTTVHFHLPKNLSVRVHREYSEFIAELVIKFPHENEGILKFYGECWKIFNALNSLELKSLEEPIYLFGQFFKKPLECLTLAYYLPQNALDIARKFIKDPELLSFIDAECFIVSTVNALQTPMINASMFYVTGVLGESTTLFMGVGGIAKLLAKGLVEQGSEILYKANVTNIIIDQGRASKLLKREDLPNGEQISKNCMSRPPLFFRFTWGSKLRFCHLIRIAIILFLSLEKPYGSIFLSIPTILDSSLAPEGRHILHIFTTSSIEDWEGLSQGNYEAKKELVADKIISRLENKLFPGLKSSIVFKECHHRPLPEPPQTTTTTMASVMVVEPKPLPNPPATLPAILPDPYSSSDDEDDLYSRLKSLERQLEFIEIQEAYVKDEQKNLQRELLRAQAEVKRLQSVPLVIGPFMEMIDDSSTIYTAAMVV